MIVGVLKEIKANENRVGLVPAGVDALVKKGHTVLVESQAGIGSGITDQDFINTGAKIIKTPQKITEQADMIIKVKEPLPSEYNLFKKGQIIFTYLHLAAVPDLVDALIENEVTAIAYETIEGEGKTLPLLTPMSEIAGRMSVIIGAQFLEKHYGGSGVLLGGVPGIKPGKVLIVGGGIVGVNAAKMALGLGARVTIVDISLDRLRHIDDIFNMRVRTIFSTPYSITKELKDSDLLVSAVLIPGAKAPNLISEEMVKGMKTGSVIVDVAIDQGGSIETIDRVTTHDNPIFIKHGILHYSVANIPGAVSRSSTFALTNATLPYIIKLANGGLSAAYKDSGFRSGINTINKKITSKSVADSLNKKYTPIEEAINI